MEISQAEKGRPTRQEKALQMGNCGQIGTAQGSCSKEGRVMMRLNRRAGARLEGSLHSKLRKLDFLPIGNRKTVKMPLDLGFRERAPLRGRLEGRGAAMKLVSTVKVRGSVSGLGVGGGGAH